MEFGDEAPAGDLRLDVHEHSARTNRWARRAETGLTSQTPECLESPVGQRGRA